MCFIYGPTTVVLAPGVPPLHKTLTPYLIELNWAALPFVLKKKNMCKGAQFQRLMHEGFIAIFFWGIMFFWHWWCHCVDTELWLANSTLLLIWNRDTLWNNARFRGVVGYHVSLTHWRSPVRVRAKPIFLRVKYNLHPSTFIKVWISTSNFKTGQLWSSNSRKSLTFNLLRGFADE